MDRHYIACSIPTIIPITHIITISGTITSGSNGSSLAFFFCRFLTIFADSYWSRGPPCLFRASIENIAREKFSLKISVFISDFEKLNCFSYLKGKKNISAARKFFEKF